MGVPVSAKMPGCCCPVLCRFLIAVRFLVAEGVAHVLRTEGTPPEAKKARTVGPKWESSDSGKGAI